MSSGDKSRRSGIERDMNIDGVIFSKVIPFDCELDGLKYLKNEVIFNKHTTGVISPDKAYKPAWANITGVAHTKWMPDGIYMNVKPWPGTNGNVLRKALSEGAKIIPIGTGNVDENGYVRDYRLIAFSIDSHDKRLENDTIL